MQLTDVLMQKIINDPRYANNPIMQNAFNMYRNGDVKGVEQLTRNVCQSQGRDINRMLQEAQSFIGRM